MIYSCYGKILKGVDIQDMLQSSNILFYLDLLVSHNCMATAKQ